MLVMGMMKKLECQDMIIAGDFGTSKSFHEMIDIDFGKKFADLWTCTFPPFPQPRSIFFFFSRLKINI